MPTKTVYALRSGQFGYKDGVWSTPVRSTSDSQQTASGSIPNSDAFFMTYWSWTGASALSIANSARFVNATMTLRCNLNSHTGDGHPIYRLNANPLNVGSNPTNNIVNLNLGWLHNLNSTMSSSQMSDVIQGWVFNPNNAHGVISDGVLRYQPDHTNLASYAYAYVTINYENNTTPSITPVTATGSTFTTPTPSLQVRITDPDPGQTVTTYYQVARNTSFTQNVQSFSHSATNNTPVSNILKVQAVPNPLSKGRWYWRARVYDGYSYSAYTATRYFDIPNVPPQPTIGLPTSNQVFTTSEIPFTIAAIDPDDENVYGILEYWEDGSTNRHSSPILTIPTGVWFTWTSPPLQDGVWHCQLSVAESLFGEDYYKSDPVSFVVDAIQDIYIGGSIVDEIYIGSDKIDMIFVGESRVW